MKRILGWFLGFGGWGFWIKIGSVALGALGVLAAGLTIRRNGRLAERADQAQRRVQIQQKQERMRKDVDTEMDRTVVGSPERKRLRSRWTRPGG